MTRLFARRFRNPITAQNEIIFRLASIEQAIERQQVKPPAAWWDKVYSWIINILKYIGIPGLIIASIGPVQKLAADYIEAHNQTYIKNIYIEYATALLSEGQIDRANTLLSAIQSQKDFDSRILYYKARILIAMALQQGRNYTEAYDTAKILTKIQDEKDFMFPPIGGTKELIELKCALIDIDIEQQHYGAASNDLSDLLRDQRLAKDPTLAMNALYRAAVLNVLQFHLSRAQNQLETVLNEARPMNQATLVANATFQLGKAFQFDKQEDKALIQYNSAATLYKLLGDNFGVIKVYNNIAMIYQDHLSYDDARSYYNQELRVARDLGDNTSYARSLLNLALLEKIEHDYEVSLGFALEALKQFQDQNNLLGIFSASNLLSNDYFWLDNNAEAAFYAVQAYNDALPLNDLRAIASACGSMSNIYSKIGNSKEGLFSALCALSMTRISKNDETTEGKQDYASYWTQLTNFQSREPSSAFNLELISAEQRLTNLYVDLGLPKTILREEFSKITDASQSHSAP